MSPTEAMQIAADKLGVTTETVVMEANVRRGSLEYVGGKYFNVWRVEFLLMEKGEGKRVATSINYPFEVIKRSGS
jgi:hypothetical protein